MKIGEVVSRSDEEVALFDGVELFGVVAGALEEVESVGVGDLGAAGDVEAGGVDGEGVVE